MHLDWERHETGVGPLGLGGQSLQPPLRLAASPSTAPPDNTRAHARVWQRSSRQRRATCSPGSPWHVGNRASSSAAEEAWRFSIRRCEPRSLNTGRSCRLAGVGATARSRPPASGGQASSGVTMRMFMQEVAPRSSASRCVKLAWAKPLQLLEVRCSAKKRPLLAGSARRLESVAEAGWGSKRNPRRIHASRSARVSPQ